MDKKTRAILYKKLITLLYNANTGHIGSCLSCMDILAEVWFKQLKRGDKFILSKGHAAPALYVVMNQLKIISNKELNTFHQEGTRLPAHTPNYYYSSHIPFPTGSLGHGLSLSCGIAQAFKFQKKNNKIFCLMSDGECNEGQTWEAAQYASHFKLSNIIAMIDKNGYQALGKTSEVLGDSASREKWKNFGFEIFEADGHNFTQMSKVLNSARKSKVQKPKMIIFNTIKGYGVSFMANKFESHYQRLTQEQYEIALKDVEKL